eukprot:scaffold161180_cov25-Tisochrysis_lutea.AAC.1
MCALRCAPEPWMDVLSLRGMCAGWQEQVLFALGLFGRGKSEKQLQGLLSMPPVTRAHSHTHTQCMTGDTENEQPSTGPTDGPCKTSRNRPEPDSLHCYNRNNRGTHLCVFVHGYQGASTDLSLIKGQM